MPALPASSTPDNTAQSSALLSALAALQASSADQFDPVRFRYIQTLARRSLQQKPVVASLLITKAQDALHAYETDIFEQRAHGAALLEKCASQNPQMTTQLYALFEAFNFKAIERLAARKHKADSNETLVLLTQQLNASGDTFNNTLPPASASDDALHNQVHDSAERSSPAHCATYAKPSGRSRELRATQFFRDALQQQHADQLVSRALMEALESAGPLNPQKLALRSLVIMREISPAYLGHFVSYLETLFWLEKS